MGYRVPETIHFRKSYIPFKYTPRVSQEFAPPKLRSLYKRNGCHPVVWHNKNIYRYLRQYTTNNCCVLT